MALLLCLRGSLDFGVSLQLHYFPVTLFTHTNAAEGEEACLTGSSGHQT